MIKRPEWILYSAEAGDLLASKINVHQGAVALVSNKIVASTHYQVYRFHSSDAEKKYVLYVLRSPQFLSLLNEQKNKGIKNEQGPEFYLEFEIPLPPIEDQRTIVAEIERFQSIVDGANLS